MYRFKNGKEYYVFPGGGVEEGESIEDAVVREGKEETGLDVKIVKKLWEEENNGRMEHFFVVEIADGEMKIGGPEEQRQSADNVYRLEWVSLANISGLNLVPNSGKQKLLENFGK